MVKIKLRSIFAVIVLLTSCQSNEISFDVKNQILVSCSSKKFDRFSVVNENNLDVYEFRFSASSFFAPDKFNINKITKEFEIKKNMIMISVGDFKLSPLSRYTIRRTGGDASGYKIRIWTDSLGFVVKTTKPICN